MKNIKHLIAIMVFLFSALCSSQASATWLMIHGTSGHLEDESTSSAFTRTGAGLVVKPLSSASRWVHFAVPTNGDGTAGARFVKLVFTVDHSVDSSISQIDIYNGNVLIKSFTGLNWNTLGLNSKILDLGSLKHFVRGMGVSVQVTGGPDADIDQFTFHGVGAKFVP